MSTTEAAAQEICASCGIKGSDNVKLKNCNACKLVKYCGLECQRNHRPQHKRACKKRAAELKDELLFKQPESTHLGDCPICLLPLPFANPKDKLTIVMTCCSKVLCGGCIYTNILREREERLTQKCPFCRHLVAETDEEMRQNAKKRVEANDPVALCCAGMHRFEAGDYATAIDYWEKAAGLGEIESYNYLSMAYQNGFGVEKDIKKNIHNLEQAAIGGHPIARHNLGMWEKDKGNIVGAVKHFVIAANLGFDQSLQALKKYYAQGDITKQDFAAALRAFQATVDSMKSPQRDAAKAARNYE